LWKWKLWEVVVVLVVVVEVVLVEVVVGKVVVVAVHAATEAVKLWHSWYFATGHVLKSKQMVCSPDTDFERV
jgi:hypothetical protein